MSKKIFEAGQHNNCRFLQKKIVKKFVSEGVNEEIKSEEKKNGDELDLKNDCDYEGKIKELKDHLDKSELQNTVKDLQSQIEKMQENDNEQNKQIDNLKIWIIGKSIMLNSKNKWNNIKLNLKNLKEYNQNTILNNSNLKRMHSGTKAEKSVFVQKIAYLWASKQMWNDRFQLLLQIFLEKKHGQKR
ncbi:hypothetical protein RFI_36712 [Reticulomyxa filosa]|uniref:Uncharacterized protein n=1 Tax=Reticulomyxa filosa TaxID=46433 RepID=X6LFF7_RETFI|nr:hypothetical protein RFI_36712 [Reticulomyxa filosa]|eukprot:ETO00728.1 hypothetical protein RFI_36712 [Reticulomyxa filosa]